MLLAIFLATLLSCSFTHATTSTLVGNEIKPRHINLLKNALRYEVPSGKQSGLWGPLGDSGWRPYTRSANVSLLPPRSRGYIQVFLTGGLNQQRLGICDAVAVAKLLNATLVIPYLQVNRVWRDSSSFDDIFDVGHLIDVLKDDISIVKKLPKKFSWSTREYYSLASRPTKLSRVPNHASAHWYSENVLPILSRYGIAAISPFSHRLNFDNLPIDIQRLRCKVNFQALVFVPHIRELGDTLVNRLQYPSNKDKPYDYPKAEKFVALHLRFDKDMAAHSACYFGGGKAETLELAKYRRMIWRTVPNSHFTDEQLRRLGRCPLTPEEVGLLLRALGFDNSTRIYLASHKVYGGEARISILRNLFPLMEDKSSLSSAAEQAQVKGNASLLAAVDYYVALQSDVFISASRGNMNNALVGHRTYLNLKTIRPNMSLLGQLFLNRSIGWSEFQQAVVKGHRHRLGKIRLRKPKLSIYAYPAPDCMCQA